jgi:hypothetical protein
MKFDWSTWPLEGDLRANGIGSWNPGHWHVSHNDITSRDATQWRARADSCTVLRAFGADGWERARWCTGRCFVFSLGQEEEADE